ncbi:glycogen debranching protein GlgX [Suttonella sp. R2A3]|uniref:glycogen debranching protein GlgX n=1 Tax=Suttonella sp. R2A3 TaxID=2908648 RepID=UPI001F1AB312|nr:glycogen debranching protein GlgX [Suttonella sp. R2A3]UJF25026.1 glycogen debranching protein GlgX [Suttonella sp. R2A3]
MKARAYPLGVTLREGGANVALFSRNASQVWLCLFDDAGKETRHELAYREDDVFFDFIPDIKVGQRYGFRVAGEGKCFNPQKLLIDPYAKALCGKPRYGSAEEAAWFHYKDPRDNAERAVQSIVIDERFAWDDDVLLQTPWAQTVLYEVNVKGFSAERPEVPHEQRGTFLGLAHPASLAHLKALGITAVELQPVTFGLDEPHLQRLGLSNYWGYNVLGAFALDPRFAVNDPLLEFKTLVKALHQTGIEVILDVVFNHSAEGELDGPMLGARGIDNASYYWNDGQGNYANWSGCGNTLKLDEPMVMRWVLDSLRYWAEACHVDGFRFDLGTVLARTPHFDNRAALLQAMAQDPLLATRKMIVEPWDLDTYQLGAFPPPFAQWNDRFRDDMRRFWLRGDLSLGDFAMRFAGSADVFRHQHQSVWRSVNFITAHDGFTLADLLSYQHKHNEANGEDNHDGHDENFSNNHGVEGPSDNLQVLEARAQSAEALLATLLLANGTPMLLAGDDIGHSQQGNNNAYCQDNALTWLAWLEADELLHEKVQALLALRKKLVADGVLGSWWDEDAQWFNGVGAAMVEEDWRSHDGVLQLVLKNRWLVVIHRVSNEQSLNLPEGDWQAVYGQRCTLEDDRRALCYGSGISVFRHNLLI